MKVFSIGGSVVRENLKQIDKLAKALDREEKTIVVTGAGGLSKYQDASNGTEAEKDLIGIKATRLHAQLVLTELEDTNEEMPLTPEELKEKATNHNTVVCGGLVPGYSTDAVAATAAELLGGDLYIATTVDGVYTDDPEKEGAEKLEKVEVENLAKLISGNSSAGDYSLIDSQALSLIKRSEIPTKFFRGKLENIEDPDRADGTEVVFS